MKAASTPPQIRAPVFGVSDFVLRVRGFLADLEIQASEF
jgi:hypothetical protein